ncbi:hypothetical protein DINM_005353 [Dirofilaria immitis]|nr:hypothetical protein [Dirofilaria immitis]
MNSRCNNAHPKLGSMKIAGRGARLKQLYIIAHTNSRYRTLPNTDTEELHRSSMSFLVGENDGRTKLNKIELNGTRASFLVVLGTLSLSRLHFPLALSRLTFVNQLSQRLTDRSATVRLMPMAPFQVQVLLTLHYSPNLRKRTDE